MSKKKDPGFPERPEWLQEFNRRNEFIKVLDMAFDPTHSDKAVRHALMVIAQDMGELFAQKQG